MDSDSLGMVSFQQLLSRLPTPAYTCDPDGLITNFNHPAEQLWGRRPALNNPDDRYCGAHKLYNADGELIGCEDSGMAKALETGHDYVGEKVIIERPDGSQLTVLEHATPIRDESGRLIGAINVLVDVSDQLHAHAAQAKLASIVESSDDAIIGKTLDGTILSWNAGAERLFGYRADEVIGSSITIIVPLDRRSEEIQILDRIARGQRIEHFETIRVNRDGRHLDISLTVSPIRDREGRIIGASKIGRDITAQKRSEEAIIAIKNELAVQLNDLQCLHDMSVQLTAVREVQDLSPLLNEVLRTATAIHATDIGLLWLTTADGTALEVGASLGLSPEILEMIKVVPVGEGPWGRCLEARERVIIDDTDTNPTFAELRELAQQAEFRSVHCTPLQTRAGNVLGVLCTFQYVPHYPVARELRLIDLCARQAADFIENARLYAQLREIDKRKDEFLATLAHELRNPLAPISNSLHIMSLSGDLGPTGDAMHGIMERQVTHLTRLVDDLMDVSRITRGKIQLQKERVNLTSVIATAIESCRPLIEAAGHQIAVSLYKQPVTLEADAVRLTQVITNLLNNAVKYTTPPGQIWLTMKFENGQAVITVKDTGVGIAPDMLGRVFEMFAQIDRTIKRSQGGLGIGLTLAQSFVEMHGGTITAHSDGPNQGSEFVVTLPAVDSEEVTQPVGNDKSSSALPVHRILIVDDLHSSAYTLSRLLEKLGQQVVMTSDPVSVLEQIKTLKPDLIISDIAMPEMDGYELARLIREQGPPEIVMVALTGYGQSSDRAKSLEAGFDHHLVKPVALDALLELMRSLPEPPQLHPAPSSSN